jgi:D-serine deaminase-like pyridoxal phosphate-dependent protein
VKSQCSPIGNKTHIWLSQKEKIIMIEKTIPYHSIDTPALLLDMDKLEENIKEMSQLAAEAGVRLRPHVKIHGCAEIARMQLKAGACGIEVGPVAQAECMVNEGIKDIKIAHPGFYGEHKSESLKRILLNADVKVTVVIDMIEQVEQISHIGKMLGREVPVNIKIDTSIVAGGLSRHGVQTDEEALTLAKKASQLPNVKVTGIYAHEMGVQATEETLDSSAYKTLEIMSNLAIKFKKAGIQLSDVSVGASPQYRYTCKYLKEGKFREVNELHPGNFVIGSLVYWKAGGNKIENCALSLLVTVMSTTHPDWFMIDAGYKTFSPDYLLGAMSEPGYFWNYKGIPLPSFGLVKGRTDLRAATLSAESAHIYYMNYAKPKLHIGDRLEIIPNNSTCVINIHDRLYGVRNGILERVIPVTCRGRGN